MSRYKKIRVKQKMTIIFKDDTDIKIDPEKIKEMYIDMNEVRVIIVKKAKRW